MKKKTLIILIVVAVLTSVIGIAFTILEIRALTITSILFNLVFAITVIILCGVFMVNAEQTVNKNIEKANNSMLLAVNSYAVDMLTTACNRFKYKDDLNAQRDNRVQAIYCSLSNIDEINTKYGEDYTDDILVNSVKSIRNHIKECCVYRTGSAEFMIVVSRLFDTDILKDNAILLQEELKSLVPNNVSSYWKVFGCQGLFKENLLTAMRKEADKSKFIFKNFQYN